MHITPIYAALLALLFVFLGIRTIRLRRRLGVALGHADHPSLLRAARVHANFAEYVPFALGMIYLVESASASWLLVHLLGAGLLAGRLAHAAGVSREPEDFRFRVVGMAATFSVLLVCAGVLLWHGLVG